MTRLEFLQDNLAYNREALSQLLLVSTLLAGVSASGLVALVVGSERGPLRRGLAALLAAASLAFIFATILDAVLQPGMHKAPGSLNEAQILGLLHLGQWAVWAMLIGAVLLAAAIGGLGFVFCRRLGWATLAMAVSATALFVWCAVRLWALLR